MPNSKHEKIWKRYFLKSKFATNLIKVLPFVRLVGLNGSMVRGIFKNTSDIDFLIIAEKNRLFTTRLLVTLVLKLFNLKKSDKNIAGRVCLNRWATVNQLEITPHNHYHAWTFSPLLPLYSDMSCYEQFITSNQWMTITKDLT